MINSVTSIEDIMSIAENELTVTAVTEMFLPARAFLLGKAEAFFKDKCCIGCWVNWIRPIASTGLDVSFEGCKKPTFEERKEPREMLSELLGKQWTLEEVGCFFGDGEDVLLEAKFPTGQILFIGLQEKFLDEDEMGYNVFSVKYTDPTGHSISVFCVDGIISIELNQAWVQGSYVTSTARDKHIINDGRVRQARFLIRRVAELLDKLLYGGMVMR